MLYTSNISDDARGSYLIKLNSVTLCSCTCCFKFFRFKKHDENKRNINISHVFLVVLALTQAGYY